MQHCTSCPFLPSWSRNVESSMLKSTMRPTYRMLVLVMTLHLRPRNCSGFNPPPSAAMMLLLSMYCFFMYTIWRMYYYLMTLFSGVARIITQHITHHSHHHYQHCCPPWRRSCCWAHHPQAWSSAAAPVAAMPPCPTVFVVCESDVSYTVVVQFYIHGAVLHTWCCLTNNCIP